MVKLAILAKTEREEVKEASFFSSVSFSRKATELVELGLNTTNTRVVLMIWLKSV